MTENPNFVLGLVFRLNKATGDQLHPSGVKKKKKNLKGSTLKTLRQERKCTPYLKHYRDLGKYPKDNSISKM